MVEALAVDEASVHAHMHARTHTQHTASSVYILLHSQDPLVLIFRDNAVLQHGWPRSSRLRT